MALNNREKKRSRAVFKIRLLYVNYSGVDLFTLLHPLFLGTICMNKFIWAVYSLKSTKIIGIHLPPRNERGSAQNEINEKEMEYDISKPFETREFQRELRKHLKKDRRREGEQT